MKERIILCVPEIYYIIYSTSDTSVVSTAKRRLPLHLFLTDITVIGQLHLWSQSTEYIILYLKFALISSQNYMERNSSMNTSPVKHSWWTDFGTFVMKSVQKPQQMSCMDGWLLYRPTGSNVVIR